MSKVDHLTPIVDAVHDARRRYVVEGTSEAESGYGPPFKAPWFVIDSATAEPEVNWPGEWMGEFETASAANLHVSKLIVSTALVAAAKIADTYAEQNRRVAAESLRRANRLGNDPFGHGELAATGAMEVDAAMREAEAIAEKLRGLASAAKGEPQ